MPLNLTLGSLEMAVNHASADRCFAPSVERTVKTTLPAPGVAAVASAFAECQKLREVYIGTERIEAAAAAGMTAAAIKQNVRLEMPGQGILTTPS